LSSFSTFIANRLFSQNKKGFSKLIVNIASIAIALSFSVILLANMIINGFKSEVQSKMFGLWGQMQVLPYLENQSYESTPIYLNDSLKKELEKMPGVVDIRGAATKAGILKWNDQLEGVIVKGLDTNWNQSNVQAYFKEGNFIQNKDTSLHNEAIISDLMASRLNIKMGDKCYLYFMDKSPRLRRMKIVGIFHSGIDDYDKNMIWVDIRHIRKLNAWKNAECGNYEIYGDLNKLTKLQNEWNAKLPQNLVAVPLRDLKPQIFDWLELQNTNEWVILLVMGGVAIINVIATILILILERTQMLGIFKAMGASEWQLFKLFFKYNFRIALRGLLWGNLVAIVFYVVQSQTHLIKLDEASYFISFVPLKFVITDFIQLNLVLLLAISLGAFLPLLYIRRLKTVVLLRWT
jgi:lipoprotein-releasing system permease protein